MQKKKFITGFIKRHPDGFGFLIPDQKEHQDVYIPKHSMLGVMTNDKVMVDVSPEPGSDRFRGDIIKIISRGIKQLVGKFYIMNAGYGYIKDEGKGWGQDLKIKMEDSMGAEPGQLVAAEILSFPEEGKEFTGKIIEIIGSHLDPIQDIRRTVFSQHIPTEFSKQTLNEVKDLQPNPTEKDFQNRIDLRDIDLITIDGATAKDFDDAVCVNTNQEGFLLHVAIADVSHYVKIGTSLDKDAYERGTSVYFPNYVIPMLPEILSNGLCSLNSHVPRLCLVAEIQFDFSGEVMRSNFYEAVMQSKARVTYGEAQEIIDGSDIEKFSHVKENILRCADLAKILMGQRFKNGSLDLEIPENEIIIDASGIPIDIIKSERLFAHRLIEELMLAANVAVATFLSSKGIPSIYRIHEPPNEQAIKLLEKYLWNFGGKTNLSMGKLQKRLTKALEEFQNKPEAQILNILTLRSMSQAKYSMNNVGHFGLGFEFYTHFTSPIRRYPDLIVHRLLKNQVMKNSSYRLMSEDDLQTAGTHLSACEQRSVKAERQVHSIKKARFMEKYVGEEFEGMISSVARFGVFVLLRQFDVDGLVKIDQLGDDRFEYDEENLCLFAKRSGLRYSIGDQIKIKVESVDTELGQINFIPSEEFQKSLPTKKNKKQDSAKEDSYKKEFSRKDSFRKESSKKNSFGREGFKKETNNKENSTKEKKLSKKLQYAQNTKAPETEREALGKYKPPKEKFKSKGKSSAQSSKKTDTSGGSKSGGNRNKLNIKVSKSPFAKFMKKKSK